MMKHVLLSSFLTLCIVLVTQAQNLVPNPSFENVDCQISLVFPFGCTVDNNPPWYQPSAGSSDSFNSCHTGDFGSFLVPSNFQGNQATMPGAGNGYAGVMTFENMGIEYREYIQVELTDPLIAGEEYFLEFHCSLADNSTFASDGLAMLLTVGPVIGAGQGLISGSPQLVAGTISDSNGWTAVEGNYIATGGESHLTIGNFYSDAQTTTIPTGQGSFERAFYYVDEISVQAASATGLTDLSIDRNELKIVPNPANDIITVAVEISNGELVQIYDVLGKDVSSNTSIPASSLERSHIDISGLEPGIYTLRIGNTTGTFLKVSE